MNIKYGINGTGKSTIALAIEKNDNLSFLKSFGSKEEPNIEFSEKINKIVTFNQDFVNNIVFNGNMVIENSFEIFIKSEKYDEKRKIILDDLKSLNKETISDENTKSLLDTLEILEPKLKLTSGGEVFQTSNFKSILNKENIYNIPQELKKYTEFLSNTENNISWIDWKTKGFAFDNENKCPFCTDNFKSDYVTEKEKFKETYKKNDVKNLNEIKQSLENLQDYLNPVNYIKLQSCIMESINNQEIELIFKKFIVEYQYVLNKFLNIINFDSYNFKNSAEISSLDVILKSLKFDMEGLEYFKSELFNSICNTINEKIDKILEKVDQLKAEVGAINGIIKSTIETSKKEINDFLEIAGFDYKFDLIVEDDGKAKTLLNYTKTETNVDNIEKHLSWGEKNAFALVLFMFFALSQNADLIILDDPISSFDGNKKYAIIDRLFANKSVLKSLRNRTVLMLTHDFEPVIDFVVNGKPNEEAIVNYIKNENGTIKEYQITKENDIELISSLYYAYSKNKNINMISRNSFLRKFIEISNVNENIEMKVAYEVLSCLIHGKNKIDRKVSHDEFESIPEDEIKIGIQYIKEFIPEFEYNEILSKYYNKEKIIELYNAEKNSYLKLQIFRVYIEISGKRRELDDVVIKFVDEIFHVENDYIYSLDLLKYNTIPNFISDKIKEFMEIQ